MKKALLLLLLTFFFVRINTSSSVPYTLFLSKFKKDPQVGEYVTIRHFGQNLVKKIAGKAGDSIDLIENRIFVRGVDLGYIQEGIEPIRIKTIPKDSYFVYGTHLKSFDSRYEPFGLIEKKKIVEVLCPLF